MSTPSEEPIQLSQSCAGASSCQVPMVSEKGEYSQSLWDSNCDSEILIASHFSPINFAGWTPWSLETPVDCTDIGYPPNSTGTADEGFVLDKESRENTDWFPKLEGVTDYHNIKLGEPGFYEYGSCCFPKNWSKREPPKGKKKWSVHDLPHDLLHNLDFFDNLQEPECFVAPEPEKGNPPKTSLKQLFEGEEEVNSRTRG